jgi:LysR family transcriptional regulator, glycine cleavage system transcriptional activator
MTALLPPLHTLRAFEAIARCGSFGKAAEEIFLTKSAVSHQIRVLEEFYGIALLERTRGQARLTPAGEKLLPLVRGALDALRTGTQALRDGDRTVRISVLPSFANRWLLRRIGAFIGRHQDLDVQLFSSQELADLRRDDFALAVRYGVGEWPGVHAELLANETLFAVARPGFVGADHARLEEALRRGPLLRDQYVPWARYLRILGIAQKDCRMGTLYGDSSQILDAAERGDGIALARSLLVEDALREGKLERLGGLQLPAPGAYYLVSERSADQMPQGCALLRDWLREAISTR